MQNNKRKNVRIIEVLTGIIIVLAALSVVLSFLFNFEFTGPDHSLAEDLNNLADNTAQQRSSSISWMVTASLFVILLPFYLVIFYRDQPLIHILNSLVITGMAVAFFRASLAGFAVVEIIKALPADQPSQPDPQVLTYIRDMVMLTRIGLTAYGSFVILLSISRFRKTRFNIFGRILLFLSGPLLVIFTWVDPEHVLFNTALAAASIGLFITGVNFVNKGMVQSILEAVKEKGSRSKKQTE